MTVKIHPKFHHFNYLHTFQKTTYTINYNKQMQLWNKRTKWDTKVQGPRCISSTSVLSIIYTANNT